MFNIFANQAKIIALTFQFMKSLFISFKKKYHINEEK